MSDFLFKNYIKIHVKYINDELKCSITDVQIKRKQRKKKKTRNIMLNKRSHPQRLCIRLFYFNDILEITTLQCKRTRQSSSGVN